MVGTPPPRCHATNGRYPIAFPGFHLGFPVTFVYNPGVKPSGALLWFLLGAGVLGTLWLLRLWLRCQATYEIGRTSFRIRIFGLTVRRILYRDVDRISKIRRHYRWIELEDWSNTLSASRRELVIHRKSGVFRKLVVTPTHRYEFRSQFRAAVAAATGSEVDTEGDSETEVAVARE